MNTKFKFYCIVLLVGLLSLWLTGCIGISSETLVSPITIVGSYEQPVITGPVKARDVALAYIRTYHPEMGPSEEAFWFSEPGTADDLVGISMTYRYEDWVVQVSFGDETPDQTIYTVSVERSEPKFIWQGLVIPSGQVVETTYYVADPTSTILKPTWTATPSQTASPTPTATVTPVPTATPQPTATLVPEPCNAAEFIADVTIQDGSTFSPGAKFTKIWRLKNVGTCPWKTDYELVFVDGNRMDGAQIQPLKNMVRPGDTVDFSVEMAAPQEPGDYQGLWMLRDRGDSRFGLGPGANLPFWVSISVVDFEEGGYAYDFALNYCAASWRSESGQIPCPGFFDSKDGFVQLLANADLESRREDEATMWVHPYEARGGWIEGIYPPYEVQSGDHFKGWVGCMQGHPRCDMTFYLDYEDLDGNIIRLGEWVEKYDGEVTQIDLDLSALEGKNIRFIFGVEANTKNAGDAQGFWFVPRID